MKVNKYSNSIGVLVPEVMLPPKGTNMEKWAVVACDQFTSQKEYWEEARRIIGNNPSTLDLILPEAYLGSSDEQERISAIKANMKEYLKKGLLQKQPQGFILVERTCNGNTRHGLIMALDLEEYDYSKGSGTLIRATEGTIVSRIPPRLRIREGAAVELPHILVLIDDPDRTVIEPLLDKADDYPCLYDTDLMLQGGHIKGCIVKEPDDIQSVLDSLSKLADKTSFTQKYGDYPVLLFAMGDGNHSLATAKANWEKIKTTLSEDEREEHPARYALVELNNVHDAGIIFEPIHRVVFGVDPQTFIKSLSEQLNAQNGSVEILSYPCTPEGGKKHVIPFYSENAEGAFVIADPASQLAVGTLQNAIDAVLSKSGGEVDYIHGDDVVKDLSKKSNTVGFLLPTMMKGELFSTVIYDGALPRKTFSMGEAAEKRYYMEARLLER